VEIFLIAFVVVALAFLGLASGSLLGGRGLAGGCRARLGAPPNAGCLDCAAGARQEKLPSTNTKRRSEAP
jgi:hypothetical protein